jgi:hypothetical protein
MRKAVSSNAMPCHHALAEALRAYIDTAGIVEDRTGWLFRTARGHDGSSLSDKQMSQPDAVEDAWHRRGPVAAAASAGGSRGGRAAYILCAQQSRCPLRSTAYSNYPTRAMCRYAGRAAPEFVITARPG